MTEARTPIHGRNNFDFLRFVLASLVVFSHSYPLATGTEADEPLARLTKGQLTFGSLAVDAFFILSGFLIAQSWVSAPVAGVFLKKRFRRIYPGFLVAATLGAFVVAPLFSTAGYAAIDGGFVASFVGKALRLIASVPGPAFPHNPAPGTVNGSLWSIAYEFWCYILVLVCGLAGWLRRPRVLGVALAVAVAISLVFAITNIHPGGSFLGVIFGYPPFWARLLPYFLAGMAFHAGRASIPLDGRGAVACTVLLVVASQLAHGMTVVLPLAAAYLLLWAAQLRLPLVDRFAKHGDFSYGIYLYSFPLLQIVMAWRGRPWAPLPLFAVAWVLSIMVAVASWHLVEKRFVLRRKSPAPPAPRAVPAPGGEPV